MPSNNDTFDEGRVSVLESLVKTLEQRVESMGNQLYSQNGLHVQMARCSDEIARLKQMEAIVQATVLTCNQNASAIQRLTEARGKQMAWWQQLLLAVLVAIAAAISTAILNESKHKQPPMEQHRPYRDVYPYPHIPPP